MVNTYIIDLLIWQHIGFTQQKFILFYFFPLLLLKWLWSTLFG